MIETVQIRRMTVPTLSFTSRIKIKVAATGLALIIFGMNATAAGAPASGRVTDAQMRFHGSLPARVKLGLNLVKQKAYQKAINLLAPYSNEISNDGLIVLAIAYDRTNDVPDEIQALKQLVVRDPNHFRPHYLLGLAYKRAGKFTKAVTNLRQSITFAPKHRPSYDALLAIFTKKKEDYESRMLLQRMVHEFGPRKDLLARECKLYDVDGFLKQAIETCQSAITADGSLPDNRIYLAQAYYNSGKATAAEHVFNDIGRQFKNSEFAQYATGQFYYTQNNYPAAVRYLTLAVHLKPKSARSQLSLAMSLFKMKRYNSALIHFNLACRLDKKNDSFTEFQNAATKLRDEDQNVMADKYDEKTATCRGN